MTKRRVQGGGATSERRRRDGVSGKSHLRGLLVLFVTEKYDKYKVSLILFVQVKSGRKENFLLPRKTLTKADKKDKIYKR